ncbi:MAG: chemotaxis protein CheW [Treponemataceae bacterium]
MSKLAAEEIDQIFVFAIGQMKHALSLSGVEKVELAAEVTPISEAPRIVIGAINLRGQILPVISMRRRLHFPDRRVMASDRIVIVRSSRRRIALVVDEVIGVRPMKRNDFIKADAISEGLGCVAGAARIDGEITMIHDLELFLSEEDEKALENV